MYIALQVEQLKLVVRDLESRRKDEMRNHLEAIQAMRHARAAEKAQAQELHSQLQVR